ncbi:Uncharacterised protein [Vibrio cholerae]|nr:Uncharacterised protein [Vibrio cholerae]
MIIYCLSWKNAIWPICTISLTNCGVSSFKR